jgi:hypothetical protein
VGWFTCFGIGARSGGVASGDQRPLGGGIDLPVGGIERGQQQQAALEAAGIARARHGHVQMFAGLLKRRQRRGDEHGSHIFHLHRRLQHRRGNLHPHAGQNAGQRLHREKRLLLVAGAFKPTTSP